MILTFDTHGNDKQKQVARYWCDRETTEIAYGGSKGCFVSGTLIQTTNGLKSIDLIQQGDMVWSFNVQSKSAELKPVIRTYKHGGDTQRLMIKFVLRNGTQINCTDNHEFYFGSNWVAARIIARRVVGLCGEYKKSLPDFNERKVNDYWIQGQQDTQHDEASAGHKGLYANQYSDGFRQNTSREITPSGCSGIHSKSKQLSGSKSHRLQSIQQQIGKSGMGYTQAEHGAFSPPHERVSERAQAPKSGKRLKGLECKTNGTGCNGNPSKIQTEGLYTRNAGERVWGKFGHNQRCDTSELATREIRIEEISHVEYWHTTDPVYDLCVADNHNYTLSDGIIVHNSGKSFLGCSLVFGSGFMYPGTHYFIARRELNDLRKYTIPSIHEVVSDVWKLDQRYFRFNGQDNYFTLYNNSRVYLLAAAYAPSDPNYARLGSMQMTGGWIEEGGEDGFEREAKANLSASIGRWKNKEYNLKGKLLITCNPSKNFLYPEFYEPNKKGTLPAFRKFVQALPQDNKMLPPGYLEHLQNTLSENSKQRLLYGNWEYDDDPTVLCEIVKINDIFTNTFVKPGEKVITCDVARFGKDKTVIMVWDGWRIVQCVTIDRSSTTQTATAIKQLQAKYNIPASSVIVDEDGIGGGVVDLCSGSVGFIANHSPIYIPGHENESYGTLKDQCGWWLSDRINTAEVYAGKLEGEHREFATKELEQLKAKEIDHEGKNRLVSKDVIKQNIGRSPDFLDNFIMRSYFDILKRTQRSRFVGAR